MDRIKTIIPPDIQAIKESKTIWNQIAKPLGSLGLLEDAVSKIAGITGNSDVHIDKRCAVIMCADHGVVAEGVTQTGSEVTAIVAEGIANGTANISRMAQAFSVDTVAVDIGINRDISAKGIWNKKVAYGTANIAKGPAMTVKQAEEAICAGMDVVRDLKQEGYQILVTGEMGIGNTTASSALASVLLSLPPELVTGKGAGLTKEGIERKISVIEHAIRINLSKEDKEYTKYKKHTSIELLAMLGGFDIAGMVGLFLGGAVYHVPIVMDGFISAVSAVIAAGINPLAKEYMLCSHVSKEPAGMMILELLQEKPLITAELCLGEGTGAVLLLPMLDGALAVYHSAHRFEHLPMEAYKELEE